MDEPLSKSYHTIIGIDAWNAKLSRSSRLPSWLTYFRRRKCRLHYVQYNCPHHSLVIRTTVQGCSKCAHSQGRMCLPIVVEVLSPGCCRECEDKTVRSRLERIRRSRTSLWFDYGMQPPESVERIFGIWQWSSIRTCGPYHLCTDIRISPTGHDSLDI